MTRPLTISQRRKLARAERIVQKRKEYYDRTRSFKALYRLKQAVTAAIRAACV